MTFATVSWVKIAVMLALLHAVKVPYQCRTNSPPTPHQACVTATRSCVLKFNLDLVDRYNELAKAFNLLLTFF
jgi:hypothetical protein